MTVCTPCFRRRVARWLLGLATHIDTQPCTHAQDRP